MFVPVCSRVFPAISSIDFNGEVTLDMLMASMATTGFQATNLALAVEEVNRMVRSWNTSQTFADRVTHCRSP